MMIVNSRFVSYLTMMHQYGGDCDSMWLNITYRKGSGCALFSPVLAPRRIQVIHEKLYGLKPDTFRIMLSVRAELSCGYT